MDDWVDGFAADPAHSARERQKAKELRRSSYFQNLLNRGICHFCKQKFPKSELTLDHLVPVSRGGKSTRGNLVVCCKKCNSEKKYYTPADLLLKSDKSKLSIVADDKIPFLRGVFEPYASVKYLSGSKIGNTDLIGTDILFTRTRTKVNEALLAGTPVKFVGSATIGFDHIDAAYLAANHIAWSNAPGCNAISVMQYVVSALVNLNTELSGKTIGIVGVGNVGKRVCDAAKALGMKVLLNDPPRKKTEETELFTDLDTLLGESDFVTMHVPLNAETGNMADDRFFAKMKKSAIFINSSRGEVVKEKALLDASIAGFVLDVWCNEPGPDRELTAKAIFATPHIAGYSCDGKANGTGMMIRKAAELFGIDALKNFYPTDVPEAEFPAIELSNLPEHATLQKAVNASYDIRSDDAALRENPEAFEFLREHYPTRREFDSYYAYNAPPQTGKILAALGFHIA